MSKYILTRFEAKDREKVISDIVYDLSLSLTKEDNFSGIMLIQFNLSSIIELWLDFKGKSIDYVSINDNAQEILYENYRLSLPSLIIGRNSVCIKFQGLYSNDGLGLHYITDPLDGNIYIYSQFEPFAANRVFPCFDQPNLKAIFKLIVSAPEDWKILSNSALESPPILENLHTKELYLPKTTSFLKKVHSFKPTLNISTYVFAIIAGSYAEYTIE